MACVAAALSLTAAACADDVGTSGDSEVNVKDTKANQDPKTRAIHPGSSLAAQLSETHDFFLIRFPEVRGISAESLPPKEMGRATADIVQVTQTPGNLPAPYHRNDAMNRYTDCLTTTGLTKAMNQPTGDIGQTDLTNAMNHDTTGINTAYANLIVQHDNNGTTDTATVLLEDGTVVCQIVQTRQSVISNTCVTTKQSPPPLPGVGGC